ncbi:ATP-dependent RNA helicase HrpA [Aquiluna borgnonia]|uniref:ATP-dependent RNA helicase HrpA n=1 Tax=Aquiluna borgnonia TaxID=2499157 RepID=A0A7D4Q5W4_9MICO|nr:ATP-dependent RNA helicase HrpA [Aquiluna borgnonia]
MALPITYPDELPVSMLRAEITEAIKKHQVVVVAGATGSGKTTQIPKMCLELGRTSIAHTQPRRIAARSVAERIAEELKVELGQEVGYQVRFTDTSSKRTRVKVMTDGILLNAMQFDRDLKQYDTIIIDEAHERSLNIDFLLGYLKQLLPRRPDLKLIITSATIDPESFSRHFDNAPIIEVSGRTFPIEIRYRPVNQERQEASDPDQETTADDYIDAVVSALRELQAEPDGDVLVFLSGESEIRDAQEVITGASVSGALMKQLEVLPLYGRLSASEQHRVFDQRSKPGVKRRIILATNVAETSLTIPNIKYVIDAGTARISRYSTRLKVQRLPIEAISQASANQRAGRAGRTSPGTVIRLYSEEDFKARPEFTDPEILRTNLAAVILQAANLGLGDLAKFPFLQPPDAKGVKDGRGLLLELGAIKATESEISLTPLGQQIARLPIEPRFARMLLESRQHGITREVLIVTAGLTIQDPRERPVENRERADLLHSRFTDSGSDFLTLVNLWNYLEDQQQQLSGSAFRRLCRSEHLNFLRIREWQDLVRQLSSVIKPLGLSIGPKRVNPEGIHKSILSGLISQIGLRVDPKPTFVNGKPQRARPSREYLGANGKRFFVFPGSALAKKPPAAIMSAELVETSQLFARMNASIDPAWVESLAAELCNRSISDPHWEKSQGAAIATERVTIFGLTLVAARKVQYSRHDALHARELFIRHALVAGEWDSKQGFERENRKLLEQLESEAERARRPDLIPDEEDQFRFFNNRVPLDVFSTRSFEGWWRKAKLEKPQLLNMTRANLKEVSIEAPDENEFPGSWITSGHQFELQYRFAPGEIEDGVNISIPVAVLPSLEAAEFDWLVPGMRLELVTELLRSLPKAIRRNAVPATDWAKKLLAELPEQPSGSLVERLAADLQAQIGARVQGTDFDFEKLPPALRMTYSVIDQKGKQLASSLSLAELQQRFREQGRVEVAKVATKLHVELERQDLPGWDFEKLPEVLTTTSGNNTVNAYPSLVLRGSKVDLVVQSSKDEQIRQHRFAVAELVKREIPNPAKYVESHLKPEEKLAISALSYQSFGKFVEDVIVALALSEIELKNSEGLIFNRADFESIRDSVQAKVLEVCFDTVSSCAKISNANRDALRAISSAKAIDFLSELSAEKQHIEQLLGGNFVSATGLSRLPRLPVYLRAIEVRVNKLQENPNKDRLAQAELNQALQAYESAGGRLPLPSHASAEIVRARWLLEELRVSLFAQTLGTSEPVSVQRIRKVLAG